MTTAALNQIQIVGRLGQNPEMRFFNSGNCVCKFSVAENSKNNEDPNWFNVELWNKTAEIAANYTTKGQLIGIEGSLKIEEWTDKETGELRSKPVIRANRIELLSSRKQTSTNHQVNNDDDDDDNYDW